MKKILVPTDFSEQAENALKTAAQLAKTYSCEIYLLHVIELPVNHIDALSSQSDFPEAVFFMKLASQKFENLKSKKYLKGLKVHDMVGFQDVFKGIFHISKKHDIDLIIMGSNGMSGLTEMIIGSNTEKVVRTSNTPVLVIKKEHTAFEVKNFVFASDFKEESKAPFRKALQFAEIFNANMHLLMVNTPNNFKTTGESKLIIEQFSNSFSYPHQSINIYNDLNIESGIMNFSQSISAELIGMSTHGRQGISHFFNGSISEDLVNHAKRPVITFKI